MHNLFVRPAVLLLFLIMHLGGYAQQQPIKPANPPIFASVKIGDQEWMAENLNVDRFRNGDIIPQAKNKAAWLKAVKKQTPAWCYYEFDAQNGKQYGKLYNQYAVTDGRGLAPIGWHIPSAGEWDVLSKTLGGEETAGAKLKSKTGWNVVSGTDETGYTALPAGYCNEKGSSPNRGKMTAFWSHEEGIDVIFGLSYHLSDEDGKLVQVNQWKEDGLSVRCIKD